MSQEIAIASTRRDRTITNQKCVAIAYQICAIMTQNTSQMKVAIDATIVLIFSLLHCVIRAPSASLHHRRIPIPVCFASSSLPVIIQHLPYISVLFFGHINLSLLTNNFWFNEHREATRLDFPWNNIILLLFVNFPINIL